MVAFKKDWLDYPNNYDLYNTICKYNVTFCTKKKDGSMHASDLTGVRFYEVVEALEDLECSRIEKCGFHHIIFSPPCDRRIRISLYINCFKKCGEFSASRLYSFKSYRKTFTSETLHDELQVLLNKIKTGEVCVAPKEKWGDLK